MRKARYVLLRKKARRNHNARRRQKSEQRDIDNDAERIKCPTGHRGKCRQTEKIEVGHGVVKVVML